jgi:hypothetical protein
VVSQTVMAVIIPGCHGGGFLGGHGGGFSVVMTVFSPEVMAVVFPGGHGGGFPCGGFTGGCSGLDLLWLRLWFTDVKM